ncbi:MAG: hypothetical protein GY733_16715 [bacterium]|nr:hypothetical protein [bacterium]
MSNQEYVSEKTDISMMLPIFGSHVRRIGWVRTVIGGFSMYLCIPFLVVSHLTSSLFLYQWVARPLFGTKRLEWKDYIVIDRHRIDRLPAFDKFNCMFCGYANGVCTLINKELDQFNDVKGDVGVGKRFLLVAAYVLLIPWGLISELSHQIIYNLLVSRPLGMHRVSAKEADAIIEQYGYASQFPPITRYFLKSAKSSAVRFAMGLEQIESSWCPLTHFERREGIVYPDHHKKFFGPEEIELMRHTLATEGTVSARKPTW